ncbi:hypothetical protein H6F88_00975 [Oculatella sp. FACHB-28]|uniref:hypothetical protein n=1 Tax=Oculatella sp. FACHB-28 TaxID=2692845 RepID=UPI0016870DC1|nr:hypothetical protein [Oculatella sp. FACHB-28]MBD2054615.1 hypothetical protein [Oculatella sp. FACHB-28]
MSEAIFVQNGQQLIRMEPDEYSCEEDFQQLLTDFPDLLAGEQINRTSPRRWLFISREAAIPSEEGGGDRWSLDHLFLDQDAIPTLVEVKRKSDTRLRREVVGQMLDYAANASLYWSSDIIQSRFIETTQRQGYEADQILADFLGGAQTPEHFWQTAQLNLRSGKIRLIFAADWIPSELQRIVEFLNERMNPTEVLALEIRRYSGGGLSTHIPRLIGQTSVAQIIKQPGSVATTPRKIWNESTFFEDAAQHLESSQVEVLRKVLDFCRNECAAKIDWGTGQTYGSFNPKFRGISNRSPITVLSIGTLDLKLSWLSDSSEAIAFRDIFCRKLKDAGLPHEFSDTQYSSSIPIQEWSQWSDRLLEVLCSALSEQQSGLNAI